MDKANKEIKKLFRDWMVFMIYMDATLICVGIKAFIDMEGFAPINRWGTLLCAVLTGAWGSRYTIRAYKGKI